MGERMHWNAEPRHDWPEGFYSGLGCKVCGVTGFTHPKRAPAYCWPHYQEAMREAEWRQAKWEADMSAEYGPYIPKPDPFDRPLPTPDEQRASMEQGS